MKLNADYVRCQVVKPTLDYLACWNPFAEALLMGTAAAESEFSLQADNNLWGMYGMSSSLHRAVWDEYLAFDPDLASQVRGLASQRAFLTAPDQELSTNLTYATALAWCVYRWRGMISGNAHSLAELAQCWCRGFHSHHSANTQLFTERYLKHLKAASSVAA